MRSIGVVVVIIDQPITGRPGIATGYAAKNYTEAILRGSTDDLMVSVSLRRLIPNPIWGLIDDGNGNVGSGSVGGETEFDRSEGLLRCGWRCVACRCFHWVSNLLWGPFSVSRKGAKWPFSGASCCQDRGIGHRMSQDCGKEQRRPTEGNAGAEGAFAGAI